MKLFLIISLILFFTPGYAQQQEYVVFKNGDTIFGKITRTSSLLKPTKIGFKIKDKDGNKALLNPRNVETIKSFKGVDGESIIKTVYGSSYVKLIVSGRIKVYQLIDGVIFYTSKDDSDIRFTDFGGLNDRKESHKRVRPLLKDNPYILREFDRLDGSYENIIYMIEKYNGLYD